MSDEVRAELSHDPPFCDQSRNGKHDVLWVPFGKFLEHRVRALQMSFADLARASRLSSATIDAMRRNANPLKARWTTKESLATGMKFEDWDALVAAWGRYSVVHGERSPAPSVPFTAAVGPPARVVNAEPSTPDGESRQRPGVATALVPALIFNGRKLAPRAAKQAIYGKISQQLYVNIKELVNADALIGGPHRTLEGVFEIALQEWFDRQIGSTEIFGAGADTTEARRLEG